MTTARAGTGAHRHAARHGVVTGGLEVGGEGGQTVARDQALASVYLSLTGVAIADVGQPGTRETVTHGVLAA